MKILHVITAFGRGGAENHLVDLVTHQRAAGWAVTIAYLHGSGDWVEPMRQLGVPVHLLGLRFYGDPRPWWRLRALLAGSHFDLIHAHLPPAELYVRVALASLGDAATPLIISKHNDCPFHGLPGERAMGRWVARRAALVIAISASVHRYMVGPTLGLPAIQVETILYGISTAAYPLVAPEAVAALRREWGATDGTLVIGFAGRFVGQKDIPTLIRAFARFREISGCDARLVLVGQGELLEPMRHLASEAGIGDRVVFPGFRDDVPVVMRAFDVFAITSVHEGFGLVLVEAMAAERPVVATRAGAMPEIVVDGGTGFLADGVEAFAQALTRLTDPAVRQRFGEAGCRRVNEHFAVARMCAETDAAYERVLRQAKPARQPAG
jgi:glycosyltransferase involved in cell wall biosynthesis